MDLELSEEQQDLADSARAVLEREAPVSVARLVVEESKGAEELWAKLVELDWPALAVPEEDGGLGLGVVELAVVCEQLGRVVAPGPFLPTATQFVPVLAAAGSPEQRARFLGAVAEGQLVGTLALSEADGGVDLGSLATTCTPDGGGLRLDGTKHFVLEAARADELVVAGRLAGGGPEDVALAVVPAAAVTVEPQRVLDATRGCAVVGLAGVEVGPDRVLATGPAAAAALRRALQVATTALAAEMVGTSQGAFEVVHGHVSQRAQFGVKIGSFQAVKHKMANMYVALESARATAFFAAAAVDEADPRAELAVSMAKASGADCQKLVGTEAIQCLGGIGYTWEHDAHLYVKRLKTQAALLGTGAWHRRQVARLIGL